MTTHEKIQTGPSPAYGTVDGTVDRATDSADPIGVIEPTDPVEAVV